MRVQECEVTMVPLRVSYLQFKEQFPKIIALVRVDDDTVQAFGEDARIVASVCHLELLGFDPGGGQSIPFVGLHQEVLNTCAGQLIARGYEVALLEPPEAESG